MSRASDDIRTAFGIGEWYGRVFSGLAPADRLAFARLQFGHLKDSPKPECPFRGGACSKKGGVCSLRQYVQRPDGSVAPAEGEAGALRTTCPYRFYEDDRLLPWLGERLLGHPAPKVVKEVGFLKPLPTIGQGMHGDHQQRKEIGRIDMVLVRPDSGPQLDWCAVEMQAVYFSGDSMSREFRFLADYRGADIPFPVGKRRPDYRSSGPKRLLPQLQIKVRDISRWGKRMAVVVDRSFFHALARMHFEDDISNADIAWFVVRFDEDQPLAASLALDGVYLTKLEHAVSGLTGGIARTQAEFERDIRLKLGQATDTMRV